MAKDKKKNDAPKKTESKKQDAKTPKKGGPVVEKKPGLIGRFVEYLVGVRTELKRVTWPTRAKVIYLVGVVIVTLIFFATFTAAVDWVSSEGIVALNSLAHDEPEEPRFDDQVPVEIDFGDGAGLAGDDSVEGVVGDEPSEVDFGFESLDDADTDASDDETDR